MSTDLGYRICFNYTGRDKFQAHSDESLLNSGCLAAKIKGCSSGKRRIKVVL